MLSILNKFLHRNDPPPFDTEKAVGKYLLEMPRCTARVVVASPRYDDKHYYGEIIVDAEGLLPWSEHHATAAWSSRRDEQAARQALPIWLRGADRSDRTPTYPPEPFIAVLEPYTLDFIQKGIAEIICLECGGIPCDVTRNKSNERSAGRSWHWWTDDWRCEQGHLIYHEDHEMHLYFGQNAEKSSE